MEILTATRKRVLQITLNRPDKRNALSANMCQALIEQINGAQSNPDIGAILISANGNVFCAGMDLDETGPDGPELNQMHEQVFTIGTRSLKPIVVAVNGAALGGGLGLVAQGHVVLCSDKAAFGLPEIRIGLFPFFIYRSVEAAIGSRNTLQAALTGHLFPPGVVMAWGLVQKICPAIELSECAKVMARELAKSSPEAISAGLEYVKRSRHMNDVEAGKIASELRARVMAGADFHEGVAAFKAKREARWPSLPKAFYDKE